MFDLLSKLRKTKPEPLTGAPAVRRQKSYSGQSGYVYQYYYDGKRSACRNTEAGTEFVFDVSADRKTSFPVSVFLFDSALGPWQQKSGRTLSESERYAIAKMALFQAFDEREDPVRMREDIHIRPADVEAILALLDIG